MGDGEETGSVVHTAQFFSYLHELQTLPFVNKENANEEKTEFVFVGKKIHCCLKFI